MSKKLPMVGNPYVETLQNAGVGYSAEVLAQLAIAHEIKTANLIAYIGQSIYIHENRDFTGKLVSEIAARLGVDE